MGGVDTMFNTWDLNITEASTDFASTADTGCTGPREADGSMPSACTFMHLKAGSPLIDKGTNVGLPYVGTAPDLGAYEFGATATGTGRAGGGAGTGGADGCGRPRRDDRFGEERATDKRQRRRERDGWARGHDRRGR